MTQATTPGLFTPRNMASTKPHEENQEVLTGTIERIVFHSPENGYCVLVAKPRGYKKQARIVGHFPQLVEGQWITASGSWTTHARYGEQFEASHLRLSAPATTKAIIKYLASGHIHGIGEGTAKVLLKAFGTELFDIIEETPERLLEVNGIGPHRAGLITQSWNEQKSIREIMVFLHENGIGPVRAARIYKMYGVGAVEIISENPYRLIRDIPSVGFKIADAIAQHAGIEKTAPTRLRAGINYTLDEAANEGHCGLPYETLINNASQILDVSPELADHATREEIADGYLVRLYTRGEDCVFLARLHRAEKSVSYNLQQMTRGTLPWAGLNPQQACSQAEADSNIALAPQQRQALLTALTSKVTVITGGPGVGKTTLVNVFLKAIGSRDLGIALCAPTGRAAKRISEATGYEAMTIHRLLEMSPRMGGFQRAAERPLLQQVVILDEASMVDITLMRALLDAIPSTSSLLILGDIDQLPSVGPGQVLGDIITSTAVSTVYLTEVFRQAAESRIVQAAHAINQGQLPRLSDPDPETDFHFIATQEPESAARKIVSLVKTHIPNRFGFDPHTDIQVLCPMKRGSIGTQTLNTLLQSELNPRTSPRVERFGQAFIPGNKVMQTENDYEKEVYNGDLGIVTDVYPESGTVEVLFDNGRTATYTHSQLDTLTPAYAISIHKSQGSEYPVVVIPVMTQHYPLLQRSLLYTGVTRGKRLVILVGQKKALHIALAQDISRKRWTALTDRLAEWAPTQA